MSKVNKSLRRLNLEFRKLDHRPPSNRKKRRKRYLKHKNSKTFRKGDPQLPYEDHYIKEDETQ